MTLPMGNFSKVGHPTYLLNNNLANSPLAVQKMLACIMTEEEYYSIQFYSRKMDPCYLRTNVTCTPNLPGCQVPSKTHQLKSAS